MELNYLKLAVPPFSHDAPPGTPHDSSRSKVFTIVQQGRPFPLPSSITSRQDPAGSAHSPVPHCRHKRLGAAGQHHPAPPPEAADALTTRLSTRRLLLRRRRRRTREKPHTAPAQHSRPAANPVSRRLPRLCGATRGRVPRARTSVTPRQPAQRTLRARG